MYIFDKNNISFEDAFSVRETLDTLHVIYLIFVSLALIGIEFILTELLLLSLLLPLPFHYTPWRRLDEKAV
jgi:hypothetical protein